MLHDVLRPGWLMFGGFTGAVLLAGLALCLTTGCSTLGYYAQAANGHLSLLQRARPVADVLADNSTPPAIRARLQASQQMRDFAVSTLKLPDNGSYRRYADLQRDAAVWNVVAAPELSLQLKTWCFPVMGCVGYRGYFDKAAADRLASELHGQGFEVNVYGVPAYSSLGWSNWIGGDPLLNTFITWPDADLAQLIFHELAHQVAYAADDTMFNESFATAVERIGGQRWLALHATPEQRAAYQRTQQQREDFRALTLHWRGELDRLYNDSSLDDTTKRQRKAGLLAAMRADHARIKAERWNGYSGYDAWFNRANNATLAVLATYNQLVPAFEALFQRCDADFTRFYAEVRALAALPRDQRRAKLEAQP